MIDQYISLSITELGQNQPAKGEYHTPLASVKNAFMLLSNEPWKILAMNG